MHKSVGTSIDRLTSDRPKSNKSKGTNVMFKWFKKKLRKWVFEGEEYDQKEVAASRDSIRSEHSCDERITLRLEKAIGGHIATVSKYNGKIDRWSENTYLVHDDDNLEEALTAVFIQEKISQ